MGLGPNRPDFHQPAKGNPRVHVLLREYTSNGNDINAAAKAAKVHLSTAYKWLEEAGITPAKKPRRKE